MKNIHTIITHGGGAHRDDFIACSLLLASASVTDDCKLIRGEPTEKDVNDPKVACVDVGRSNDHSKSNFDHHHLPGDHKPWCAISEVLSYLGIYEESEVGFKWLRVTEIQDSKGPFELAKFLGVDKESQLNPLMSPIEFFMIRQLGDVKGEVGETLKTLMKEFGKSQLDSLKLCKERIEFLDSNIDSIAKVVDGKLLLDLTIMKEDMNSTALHYITDWVDSRDLNPTAYLTNDVRNPNGYCMYRHKDNPSVDFRMGDYTRLGKKFVHPTGFMCTFDKTADYRAIFKAACVM